MHTFVNVAERSRVRQLAFAAMGCLVALACSENAENAAPTQSIGSVHEDISGLPQFVSVDNTPNLPFVAPVGALRMTNNGCSGTLVTPTKVLTAGHCFDNEPPTNPGFFQIPLGNKVPSAGNPTSNISTWVRITNEIDPAHDIAIATLATPIQNSQIPFPHVFTGDIAAGIQNGDLLGQGAIVGFGDTVAGGPGTFDGNRRTTSETPSIAKHPCDLFAILASPFGFTCNDDWQFEAFRSGDGIQPEPEKGDSGGPLYLRDKTGRLIVAGVDQGNYANLFGTPWTVWAPTGNPGGPQNAQFILNQLGGDADNDGVFDSIDNCPPSLCVSRGLDAAQCANNDQSDPDGDGVGEVCDNCPQAVCDGYGSTLPPLVQCKNPSQADNDGDGRGDLCDLCPSIRDAIIASSPQPDADKDGVGDACDGCPGFATFPSCATDSQCTGRSNSFCVIDVRALNASHCSDMQDADHDSVPDVCDNCPGFASIDTTNSNSMAESREQRASSSVATLGDACDAVPLVRLPAQQATVVSTFPTLGDGQGPDDQVILKNDHWVGIDPTAPATRLSSLRRTTFRHCTCVDPRAGTTIDLAHCVGQGTVCDWTAPDRTPTSWKTITVQDPSGAPLLGPDGWSLPATFSTNVATNGNAIWQWRADVLAGRVTGLGTCPGTNSQSCQTHGAIFSRVDTGFPNFSTRDSGFALRDAFAMYDTPNFELVPSVLPIFNIGAIAGCPNCLVRWFIRDVGDPFPVDIFRNIDGPTPMVLVANRLTAILHPDYAFDVTPFLTARALTTFVDNRSAWLGAVESRRVLRERVGTNLADRIPSVFVPTTLSSGMSPTYVDATRSVIDVENPAAEVAAELNLTTPAAIAGVIGGPRLQTGVTGAYSALDSAVYVLGGTNELGRPAGAIWRWSVTANVWQPILTQVQHPPSSHVLGVGYDALRQRLYSLDVDDDALPTGLFTRLIRYDLAKGTSTELFLLPFANLHQLVSLSVLEDGSLALLAADALGYTAWRIDGSGSAAIFTGVKVGLGTVLAAPAMDYDRLYVPVLRGTQIVTDDLPTAAFVPGAACTGL